MSNERMEKLPYVPVLTVISDLDLQPIRHTEIWDSDLLEIEVDEHVYEVPGYGTVYAYYNRRTTSTAYYRW